MCTLVSNNVIYNIFCSWRINNHYNMVYESLFIAIWCMNHCSSQYCVWIIYHHNMVYESLFITIWCMNHLSSQYGVQAFVYVSMNALDIFLKFLFTFWESQHATLHCCWDINNSGRNQENYVPKFCKSLKRNRKYYYSYYDRDKTKKYYYWFACVSQIYVDEIIYRKYTYIFFPKNIYLRGIR